ncbi:MAG: FixH family protein [Rhizobiaceae bacterium]|jgi:nitrogen fixation protein FixH|nr:FixH family protein [Rhizobiaceae bacterium]
MRQTLNQGPDGNRFTLNGFHVTAMFLAFFGVIITVNLFMARQAVTNWTGLVVKNSYVASQQFNEKIKAHDTVAALGWREDAAVEGRTLVWSMTDAAGAAVPAAKLTVLFNRPIGEKDDRTEIVGPDATGRFAPIPFPAPGRWVVTVKADLDGVSDFESVHRFDVSEGQ